MKAKGTHRQELWSRRIAQQEGTNQPVRAFCREHGLNEKSFYYWRRRLHCNNKPVQFALVDTTRAHETLQQPQAIELVLAGGERLRIPSEAATLRLVLSVLREPA